MIGSVPTEIEEKEEMITNTTDGTCFFYLIISVHLWTPYISNSSYFIFLFCSFWCCLRMENSVRPKTSWFAIFTRPSSQQQRFKKPVSECGHQTRQGGARPNFSHILQERQHSVDVATSMQTSR